MGHEKEDTMLLSESDKLAAPFTTQIKHGDKSFDDSVYYDHDVFFGDDHEIEEQDGDNKSVETTGLNSNLEAINERSSSRASIRVDLERASGPHDSNGTRAHKKKSKVEWTPELHKKFVQMVERLGIDQATPSRILDLMKVEGLTRHNVASHLQKYRMHRRPILPRDDNFRWPNRAESTRSYCQHKPTIMAYPPSYYPHIVSHVYNPTWTSHGSNYSDGVTTWDPPLYPTWQLPTQNLQWNPYSKMNADVWGCPLIPLPHGHYPQCPSDCFNGAHNPYNGSTLVDLSDLHPVQIQVQDQDQGHDQDQGFMDPCIIKVTPSLIRARTRTKAKAKASLKNLIFNDKGEDEIDKIVNEAITKPWLPLPLGLKPPSTLSVLNELTKQGISIIPPHPTPPHPTTL